MAVSSLGAARVAFRARRRLRRERRRAPLDPWRSAPRIALGIVAVSFALVLAGVVASRNDVSVKGESDFAPGDPSEISSLTARRFEFDAKRLADGSVRGSYRYRGFRNHRAFEASGPVTCLAVRGEEVDLVAAGLDPRDGTAALGFVNAMTDLPNVTPKGGMLYVFALP